MNSKGGCAARSIPVAAPAAPSWRRSRPAATSPRWCQTARGGACPRTCRFGGFASALFDALLPAETPTTVDEVVRAARALPDGVPFKVPLLRLAEESSGDLAKYRSGVETFFHDAMDRVSGWYKRRT